MTGCCALGSPLREGRGGNWGVNERKDEGRKDWDEGEGEEGTDK